MPTGHDKAPPPQGVTAFLTGANGFVGSHLARTLLAQGHHVRALIRPHANRSLVSDLDIEWITGDLDDRDALARGCEGATWVIHVAGRVKAPDADAFHHANHTGTVNLIESVTAAAPSIERFVYISSLAAGGPAENGVPRSEDHPDHPIAAYGESKLAGELAVMSRADQVPVVSIRPPAVYGPGDTEILGFFQAVRWHVKPVFGKRVLRLSLVYVSDLIEGILLALTSPRAPGQVFYIADDHLYTLAELEDWMQEALDTWALRVTIPGELLMFLAHAAELAGRVGRFLPSLNRNRAQDFLQRDWACTVTKARQMLGFRARVPFAEGAKKTVAWYRRQGWL